MAEKQRFSFFLRKYLSVKKITVISLRNNFDSEFTADFIFLLSNFKIRPYKQRLERP
jgi:hypothetical protein